MVPGRVPLSVLGSREAEAPTAEGDTETDEKGPTDQRCECDLKGDVPSEADHPDVLGTHRQAVDPRGDGARRPAPGRGDMRMWCDTPESGVSSPHEPLHPDSRRARRRPPDPACARGGGRRVSFRLPPGRTRARRRQAPDRRCPGARGDASRRHAISSHRFRGPLRSRPQLTCSSSTRRQPWRRSLLVHPTRS